MFGNTKITLSRARPPFILKTKQLAPQKELLIQKTNQVNQRENSMTSKRHIRFVSILLGALVLIVLIITIPVVLTRNRATSQSKEKTMTTVNISSASMTTEITKTHSTNDVASTSLSSTTNTDSNPVPTLMMESTDYASVEK
ncbi:unnamed protein product [Adineta ricciae]|uniref:Uncharacterized protein n=1 Tax=Adineta ricciae TaxID=249248 RepID=A0A814PBV0_ADIRI|nr:unnamed protein product [Adineta ricciae]